MLGYSVQKKRFLLNIPTVRWYHGLQICQVTFWVDNGLPSHRVRHLENSVIPLYFYQINKRPMHILTNETTWYVSKIFNYQTHLSKFKSHKCVSSLSYFLHINVTGWSAEAGCHIPWKQSFLFPWVHSHLLPLVLNCFSQKCIWYWSEPTTLLITSCRKLQITIFTFEYKNHAKNFEGCF